MRTAVVVGSGPGGCMALTHNEAQTLHHDVLPPNLYVADASLLPQAMGVPAHAHHPRPRQARRPPSPWCIGGNSMSRWGQVPFDSRRTLIHVEWWEAWLS